MGQCGAEIIMTGASGIEIVRCRSSLPNPPADSNIATDHGMHACEMGDEIMGYLADARRAGCEGQGKAAAAQHEHAQLRARFSNG